MTDARADVERLNQALREIAERAAADGAYRAELEANQVEQLQAAGVSVLALAGAFAEEGAEEVDVTAYGLSMTGLGGESSYVDSAACKMGSCGAFTIRACCTKSGGGAIAAGGVGSPGGAGGPGIR